jgi:hypothetical protein
MPVEITTGRMVEDESRQVPKTAEGWSLSPAVHASGTQLRKRYVTPESIAALQTTPKPSLLQRLLGRR